MKTETLCQCDQIIVWLFVVVLLKKEWYNKTNRTAHCANWKRVYRRENNILHLLMFDSNSNRLSSTISSSRVSLLSSSPLTDDVILTCHVLNKPAWSISEFCDNYQYIQDLSNINARKMKTCDKFIELVNCIKIW